MNFAVFGQGTLSIWVFFPVAVGMVAATFLLWYLYGGSFLVGKASGST
jgi:hypothetical protein